MKKHFISTLLAVLVFAIATQAQNRVKDRGFDLSAAGQTVLLGTYTWNAEADDFPRFGKDKEKTGDIWWQQETDSKQSLVPQNGALIIEVHDRNFAELTVEDLKVLRYSATPVSNKALIPGTVLALLTAEGNYAKLKIVGYRALHDFSFREAAVLSEGWKTFVLNKGNKENYHLEVEWILYTKQ
jgi:hypothetical protein